MKKTQEQKFIQLRHGNPETLELIKHPNEWSLLTLIAIRARRTQSSTNVKCLELRQALIGDYKSCGLTHQKYRTAKKNLTKWKIATFKSTNKGTIATLCDDSIYNINIDDGNNPLNNQTTNRQQTDNKQATTNNKYNKYKQRNNKPVMREY
jgi:hypothetical protein